MRGSPKGGSTQKRHPKLPRDLTLPIDRTRTLRKNVRMGQIRQTIPDDLHRWLKARAAEAGMSLQDYLIRLVQEAKDKEQQ